MKRLPSVALLLVLAGVAVEARAQAPAGPAPAAQRPAGPPCTKVAYMEFLRALTESDPGKAAQTKFDKDIAPETAKMEKLAKEITELQTKLQNAKTDAEKSTIGRDLEAKGRDGQRIQEDATRLSDELKDKLLPPIAKMVNTAVDEYAKTNCLAVVWDPSTDPSNIVYVNTSLDITSEIMRAVNAAYAKDPKLADPVAAPSLPAAPAKP